MSQTSFAPLQNKASNTEIAPSLARTYCWTFLLSPTIQYRHRCSFRKIQFASLTALAVNGATGAFHGILRGQKNSNFTQTYPKGWQRIRELVRDKQGAVAIGLYSFFAEHIDPTCGTVVCDQQFLANQMGILINKKGHYFCKGGSNNI